MVKKTVEVDIKELEFLRNAVGRFGGFIEELENGENCGDVDGEETFCPGYTEGYTEKDIKELNDEYDQAIIAINRIHPEGVK